MPLMNVGAYQFPITVPADAKGVRAILTRAVSWPAGALVRYGRDKETMSTLTPAPWLDRTGKPVDTVTVEWRWPGEAKKDLQDRYLCVPMVAGQLVVKDSALAMAASYPMTQAEVDAAPNGVHAFIRTEVVPASALLIVEVVGGPVDLTVTFEAVK